MSFKCLVFDFDGTVADTFDMALDIFNDLAMEHGFRRIEEHEIQRVRGMKLTQFLRFARISKRRLPSLLLAGRSKLAEKANDIPMVPGMLDVLKTIRPQLDKVGILTSNSEHNVSTFAQKRGLEVFDFVSSVPKLSGKAKYLKAIMMTYSLNPDDVLYIGDETRDVRAARKAKVPVAAVTWGFNSADALRDDKPDYLLDQPAQLLDIIYQEQ